MNLKKLLPFLIGALALTTACSHQDKVSSNTANAVNVANAKPVALIDEKQIYEKEKISTVSNQVTEANKAYAGKIYAQGHDAYANKHNPDAAIALLKQAVLYYPSAQSYYEIGCALQEKNNPNEALSAFQVAVSQKYAPIGDAWYKVASVYAQQNNSKEAISAMEYAFDNELSDAAKNMILTDHSLDNVRANKAFSKLLSHNFKGKERQVARFGSFIKSFPQGSLPFIVDDANVYCNPKKEMDYSYVDFIPELGERHYGREVSLRYAYISSLFKNDTFVLLAYSSFDDLYGDGDVQTRDSFLHKSVYLATYKPNGTRIDHIELASKNIPYHFMTGFLRKDMVISTRLTSYKRHKNDGDDGSVKKTVETATETTAYYKIDKQGHFQKLEELPAEHKQADQKLGMLR